MEKKKTVLFKIGVEKVPYINPVFAHTLINNPEKIIPINLKAQVVYIGKDLQAENYEETTLVHSIEVWLEEKE